MIVCLASVNKDVYMASESLAQDGDDQAHVLPLAREKSSVFIRCLKLVTIDVDVILITLNTPLNNIK